MDLEVYDAGGVALTAENISVIKSNIAAAEENKRNELLSNGK